MWFLLRFLFWLGKTSFLQNDQPPQNETDPVAMFFWCQISYSTKQNKSLWITVLHFENSFIIYRYSKTALMNVFLSLYIYIYIDCNMNEQYSAVSTKRAWLVTWFAIKASSIYNGMKVVKECTTSHTHMTTLG